MTSKQLPEGWEEGGKIVGGDWIEVSSDKLGEIVHIHRSGKIARPYDGCQIHEFEKFARDICTIGKLYFGEDWGKE